MSERCREVEITEILRSRSPELLESVDPGVVAKAACLFRLMRSPILAVELLPSGELILVLDKGTITARVDADVVDWQWSVGRSPAIPYVSFEVACFERGSVEERAPNGR
jgi:hypothetical protein